MKRRLRTILQQGLAPRELAWCVALGITIGIIPVLGVTIVLCALVAWAFRLNQVVIQAVNWLVYPAQWLLLIGWYKAGAWLFHAPPVHLDTDQVRTLIAAGLGGAIRELWTIGWHAAVAWMLAAPVLCGLFFILLLPLCQRVVPNIPSKKSDLIQSSPS